MPHERGIPSRRNSPDCTDLVPALCTHRPSLLPIEWPSEGIGLAPLERSLLSPRGRKGFTLLLGSIDGKMSKLGHLEEVKVVTRFP